MEVRTSVVNEHIVSHILKISNKSELPFSGTLPRNYRKRSDRSREQCEISVAPGDSVFMAYRLIVNKDAGAGRKTIYYTLFDEQQEEHLSREAYIDIQKREQIYLMASDAPVMLTNPEDSVRITVTVHNSGNTVEEVTLVFNVPNLREATTFTEIKARVLPMEQRRITYSFLASGNLATSRQFPVHVTAMKGKEMTIFGNRSITVQNLSSNRSYVDIHSSRSLFRARIGRELTHAQLSSIQ